VDSNKRKKKSGIFPSNYVEIIDTKLSNNNNSSNVASSQDLIFPVMPAFENPNKIRLEKKIATSKPEQPVIDSSKPKTLTSTPIPIIDKNAIAAALAKNRKSSIKSSTPPTTKKKEDSTVSSLIDLSDEPTTSAVINAPIPTYPLPTPPPSINSTSSSINSISTTDESKYNVEDDILKVDPELFQKELFGNDSQKKVN